MTEGQSTSATKTVRQLKDERDFIETQLDELNHVLMKNNVGMDDSLVDSQDFPRNDIDVFEVRHARANIIQLKNDFNDLTRQIEIALQKEIPAGLTNSTNRYHSVIYTAPPLQFTSKWATNLGVLKEISPNSPAEKAGLQNGDIVVEFGPINATNFMGIDDLAMALQVHEDIYMKVVVKRRGQYKRVNLRPRVWEGLGLLGCLMERYI